MSARLLTADAARPELALGLGIVGVVAVQRRHVVGDRQAGLAGREQRPEAGVRVLGGAEARRTSASSRGGSGSRSGGCRG